jgi:hypothetical protein
MTGFGAAQPQSSAKCGLALGLVKRQSCGSAAARAPYSAPPRHDLPRLAGGPRFVRVAPASIARGERGANAPFSRGHRSVFAELSPKMALTRELAICRLVERGANTSFNDRARSVFAELGSNQTPVREQQLQGSRHYHTGAAPRCARERVA